MKLIPITTMILATSLGGLGGCIDQYPLPNEPEVIIDRDGDGFADYNDAFPDDQSEHLDTDGDGIGNNRDQDDDNDGIEDVLDIYPLDVTNNEPVDTDPVDTDNDGLADRLDTDDDNDGVLDAQDAFPLNAHEWFDTDGDGTGNNADLDNDNDGTSDSESGFYNVNNDSDQLSYSNDWIIGTGRANDIYNRDISYTSKKDETITFFFNGQDVVEVWSELNSDHHSAKVFVDDVLVGGISLLNADREGAKVFSLSGFDAGIHKAKIVTEENNYFVIDALRIYPNTVQVSVDTDGDGIANDIDTDDDGDGVLDVNDTFPLDSSETIDTDNDGIGNNSDKDDDGDGVLDVNDAFPLDSSESIDTDNDGLGNNADKDDDGDGVLDRDDIDPLDNSKPNEFVQLHTFNDIQETQVSMNIEAEELSLISAYASSEQLFDKKDFPQFNLDDLTFTQEEDGQWRFINNSAEPVLQLVVRYNEDEISLLEFDQPVAPFSQVSFDTPTHTLSNIVYQNQMKLFLPNIVFDGGSDECDVPNIDPTKACYSNPNENDRVIYEKHVVNMHNSLNMVAFDTFISDFYTNNCEKYDGGCDVKKLSTASENLLKMGAEKHNQGLRVMRHVYKGEGVGGGSKPNIINFSSEKSGGWASVWEGYITPGSDKYRGYGGATYKTLFHEIGHAHGFSHASGMTYGLADAYPTFIDDNITMLEKEKMANKKVPMLFVEQQRTEDNKIQLNFYRLPYSYSTPVEIKLLSAAEFSGELALRNEQGNKVVLFMDDQPAATMYIRAAAENSKYYSTVKIAPEDFIE